jgi:hypothetical protein
LYDYSLTVETSLFNTGTDVSGHNLGTVNPGAVYRHWVSVKTNYEGGFLALGMARIPDIRLAALGILCNYQPVRYSAPYSAQASNRLVVLELGTVGGG